MQKAQTGITDIKGFTYDRSFTLLRSIAIFTLLTILFISFLSNNASASLLGNSKEGRACIIYFYGIGCPHCAKTTPFIDEINEKYGDKVIIQKYEVQQNLEGYNKYNQYCAIQNIPISDRKIPLVAVGNRFFMGEKTIRSNLEEEIDAVIDSGKTVCPLPGEAFCGEVEFETSKNDTNPLLPDLNLGISIPLIIGTGLIDGINPCAFAVLIFLLMFLIEISGNKKRMVKAGMAYIFAVYVSYFLAGLGLLAFIQVIGISGIIVKIAAVLAIITGIINVKDYFWYGKGISLKIPESRKAIIERWTKKANMPAAIVLGFMVSMFELPCTGSVYLAILAMLADKVTKFAAMGYLLIYNLMFVLPLIIILLVVLKGMKAEHIENWRSSQKNIMKLVMGIVLLLLGVLMLTGFI